MFRERQSVLVMYDIRDSKRLRAVAKYMEGYGQRIQYSVFHCMLTPREVARLRWEVKRFLQDEDSLIVVELCSACHQRLKDKNSKLFTEEREANFVVL